MQEIKKSKEPVVKQSFCKRTDGQTDRGESFELDFHDFLIMIYARNKE